MDSQDSAPLPAGTMVTLSVEDLDARIRALIRECAPEPAPQGGKRSGKRKHITEPDVAPSKSPRGSQYSGSQAPCELSEDELGGPWDREFHDQEGSSTPEEGSSAEEGEVLDQAPSYPDRLFALETFDKVFRHVAAALGLKYEEPPEASTSSGSTSLFNSASVLPLKKPPPPGIHLPQGFIQTIEAEWAPSSGVDSRIRAAKIYRLSEDQTALLRQPTVDAPIASLGCPSFLPADAEGMPKDPHDRRIEASAKRSLRLRRWA